MRTPCALSLLKMRKHNISSRACCGTIKDLDDNDLSLSLFLFSSASNSFFNPAVLLTSFGPQAPPLHLWLGLISSKSSPLEHTSVATINGGGGAAESWQQICPLELRRETNTEQSRETLRRKMMLFRHTSADS